jgi:hypothetical protein
MGRYDRESMPMSIWERDLMLQGALMAAGIAPLSDTPVARWKVGFSILPFITLADFSVDLLHPRSYHHGSRYLSLLLPCRRPLHCQVDQT